MSGVWVSQALLDCKGDCQSVVLTDQLMVLRGVPDIGFSSYTEPTYDLVSEYFRFQELRLGVGAEGRSTKVQAFW